MYNDYFGFKDSPFSIAPNPQFLYMSERHREALAHLLYGIKSDGGFILLTGEVGTGKTTVCRCLLGQVPEDVDTAFVLNPKLTAIELLATVCDDLGIEYPHDASIKVLVDRLNQFLLSSWEQGRRTVLIIDEAQNLDVDVLEQLRLLTNLETNERKLLQIILLGQPELLDILDREEMRQLSQRVTARFHLSALTQDEVGSYIIHRLEVAGARGELFPTHSIRRIYDLSGGIPRLINLICDRSLLGAYAENQAQVDRKIVDKAAREILGDRHRPPGRSKVPMLATAAVLAAVIVGVVFYLDQYRSELLVAVTPTPVEGPAPQAEPVEASDDPPIETEPSPAPAPVEEAIEEPVAVASVLPAEPEPDPLDALIDVEGEASLDAAMAVLFNTWQTPLPASESPPCDLAPGFGLRCLSQLGSLRDIRHLDRPAAIRLEIASLEHHVVITSISDGIVTVSSASGDYRLAERDVIRTWDGNFTILWQVPPEYRTVKLGDTGATVDWLHRQLSIAQATGAETAIVGGTFDEALERRVKQFQISQGLKPDGIAGTITWIHLNSAVGANVPHLDSSRGGS